MHAIIRLVPVTMLLTSLAAAAIGQVPPVDEPLKRYLPEIQRLESRADWNGLERYAGEALSSLESQLGADAPDVAAPLSWLSYALEQKGRYEEAEKLDLRALAIVEKSYGPDSEQTAAVLRNLANKQRLGGRYPQAEATLRRALRIAEKALGPERFPVGLILASLASVLEAEGHYSEAEPLYQRALTIYRKLLPPDHPEISTTINNLALLLQHEARYPEAETFFREALAIDRKTLGSRHPGTASVLGNLGNTLDAEGRFAEAEPLLREALEIDRNALGPEHWHTAADLNNLGSELHAQGRFRDAEPLIRDGALIAEKTFGRDHPNTAAAYESLALNDEALGQFGDAATHLRVACPVLSQRGVARVETTGSAQPARALETMCWTRLSVALWYWSRQGGGAAAMDQPQALRLEAFGDAQRAVQSAAGDAMARAAANTAAQASGVGSQARAYEAALLERDAVDQQFAKSAHVGGTAGLEMRQALAATRDAIVSRIERLASALQKQAPRYWEYRSPEPISVAALQAAVGVDAALLRDDEALVVILVAPGDYKGLVFALSKEQLAWAQLGLTGDQFKALVIKLRGQLDPQGYWVRGAKRMDAGGLKADPSAFDRQAAYQLYQALLGEASVHAIVQDKPVLLFVPSGALISLPPALLVTAPPAGGAAGNTDPASLRATPWLLRSKAVALVPTVSSLRTLRQFSGGRAGASSPLLAFADPAFTDLPPLPGTRREGEALVQALHGSPDSLLVGRAASKAALMARNADGRLGRVRVLEFATHGLVAGDASDLTEPALVLAAGAMPADELLLASEAATLKLNADWVLLSACNTASPDAPEAQGLSGLTRSFFFAGAKSLLVSHWRVRDDIAPILIPAMLLAERTTPALGRAQALRQASLAILDNPGLNAANPSAWAPFTLIGEAGK